MKKAKITKVVVTYKGYPNLTASFKFIKAARLYCDSVLEQFGSWLLEKELFVVLRNYG